jgi:hypothetical protein
VTEILSTVDGVARALAVAVAGADAAELPGCAGLLTTSRHAAAFSAAASVTHPDLGPGLWVVLRTAPDGARVLCVHNPTADPRSFRPAAHLPGGLTFLRGDTTTAADPDGALVCHLAAHTFVWLGHLPETGDVSDTDNLPEEERR